MYIYRYKYLQCIEGKCTVFFYIIIFFHIKEKHSFVYFLTSDLQLSVEILPALKLPTFVKHCSFSSDDDETSVQLVSWTNMLSQLLCE